MTTTPISDRIAAILTASSPTAEDVRDVLQAARGEAARLAGLKDKLRAMAMHPTTPAAEVKAARAKIADADFDAERLVVAVQALESALARAEAREAEAARLAAYEAALAERDAAAEELRKVYPEAAQRIAKALARVAASDAEVSRINREARPDGKPWIAPVETVVRGVTENGAVLNADGTPSVNRASTLVDAVNLPALDAADVVKVGSPAAFFWRKGSKGTSAASAVAA
ncbi:hypothetical protein ACTZWW_03155 [Salinarimonas sp. NSM]|uniref:hypothetical protein n=1 Tax=Salinarimonas sp. NSM TaxID=3458003 RepID=UPI0040366343